MNPDNLVTVLLAAVVGLVSWVWTLWKSHNDYKVYVAENYVKHPQMDAVRRELKFLRQLSLKIAAALHIQLPEDDSD